MDRATGLARREGRRLPGLTGNEWNCNSCTTSSSGINARTNSCLAWLVWQLPLESLKADWFELTLALTHSKIPWPKRKTEGIGTLHRATVFPVLILPSMMTFLHFSLLALGLPALTIREMNCYPSETEKGSSTRGLILVKEPTPSLSPQTRWLKPCLPEFLFSLSCFITPL